MGVTGLWKLIEPCGTPVPIETLEGKILAVDISIWLHQVVKGFQDSHGSALAHAHLLGLFHRLCKLMYYRVKPVFVFDGCVPQLKRETIARRQQQRSKLNNEANRIQNLLLEQLAKEQVVQKALGDVARELVPAKRIQAKTNEREDKDEMFKLPDLPSTSQNSSLNSSSQDETSLMETSYDSSDDEENSARRYYQNNLQAIDVKSNHFRQLPADMRYDILVDIKETRKQSSWGRLHELPAQREDFSTFQMKRLLKRRAVQESLEEAEKEMGGRTLTYTELQTYFKEEGLLPAAAIEEASRQIASDENTRFLLVQDLKKQLKEKEEKESSVKVEENMELATETKLEPKEQQLNANYEADLQLAIALSLSEKEDANLYKEEDYILKEGEKLKLNKAQREKLQNAAKGPAKTYMIEYAGMNEDEVEDILEKTQFSKETEVAEVNGAEELANIMQSLSDTDESEDDFVEVKTAETKNQLTNEEKGLEVVIDLNKPIAVDDDLFADIFKASDKKESLDTTFDSDSDADLIEVAEKIESSQERKTTTPKKNEEQQEETKNSEEEQEQTSKKNEEMPKQNEERREEETSEKNEGGKAEDGIKLAEEVGEKVKQSTMHCILEELKQKLEQIKDLNFDITEKNNVDKELDSKSTLDMLEDLHKQVRNSKKSETNEEIIVIDSAEEEETANPAENIQIKQEVIEISPPTTPLKPAKPETPTRITDFYKTDYTIKRTPEKVVELQTDADVAKVKSPFFRRKTPQSNTPKRRKSDSPTDNVDMTTPTKAAKELFPEPKPVTAADLLQEAASRLKENKTDVELRAMATDLAKDRRELESERNRQDRMGMSISQRMNAECQELLRLFGVPYIVAPMEAEAQCAFLDAVQLTNGTITDDSDIWLFGGRTVYKNFFVQNKHVLKFSAEEIEAQFKCDRQTLVQLACLVGSDYTTGVHGIGAVTALEILSSFTRTDNKNIDKSISQRIMLILDTLQRFRDWWQSSKVSAVLPGTSARHNLLKKLRNIELNEGFPSAAVIEAYLLPKVDESRTAFSWGQPDVESIKEFARKTFGWTNTKTDDILKPVLKRLSEKRNQKTMRNYFMSNNANCMRQLKVSKRVQGAIQRLGTGGEEVVADETTAGCSALEEIPAKKPKKQAAKRVKTKRATKANKNIVKESVEIPEEIEQEEVNNTMPVGPVTIKATSATNKKIPVIPQKEVIPQREKDLEEMRKKKEKAAELFKATANKNKKK